jgi:hypothetical protein
MNDGPKQSRAVRVAMSLLALLVIYGNIAVIFDPEKLGLSGWPWLPRPVALHDAFLITGMFSGYSDYNFDLVLLAERSQDGRSVDRGQRIVLPLAEHFPQRYPIVYTQVFAAHHWDMLGEQAQQAAWAALAAKIKAHHNRLHPEARVVRLQIGTYNFPQSPNGYRAGKSPSNGWSELWYGDP